MVYLRFMPGLSLNGRGMNPRSNDVSLKTEGFWHIQIYCPIQNIIWNRFISVWIVFGKWYSKAGLVLQNEVFLGRCWRYGRETERRSGAVSRRAVKVATFGMIHGFGWDEWKPNTTVGLFGSTTRALLILRSASTFEIKSNEFWSCDTCNDWQAT